MAYIDLLSYFPASMVLEKGFLIGSCRYSLNITKYLYLLSMKNKPNVFMRIKLLNNMKNIYMYKSIKRKILTLNAYVREYILIKGVTLSKFNPNN